MAKLFLIVIFAFATTTAHAEISPADFQRLEGKIDEIKDYLLQQGGVQPQALPAEVRVSEVDVSCLERLERAARDSMSRNSTVTLTHIYQWLKNCRTSPKDQAKCVITQKKHNEACFEAADRMYTSSLSPLSVSKIQEECETLTYSCR